jgi:tetratricopeptide (TPR) repeat protein
MMIEKKQQIADAFLLRKNLEYDKAISIYKPIWNESPELFNEWSGWSYAMCLKEKKQFDQSLEICRSIYLRFPGFQMIQQLYANCIYHTQFGIKQLPPLSVLKKATDAMIKLYPPQLQYSLTSKAIFKYVKALFEQNTFNAEEAENYLNKIDPSLLDRETYQFQNANGKTVEVASPLEEWYSLMVKTKAAKNNPTELLQLLDLVKKLNLKWHYGNQIWFSRKEAFAYAQLGDKTKAESILRKIMFQKKDWFLMVDLADIVEDKKEALKLFCKAALAYGDTPKKIKLFQKLYDLLILEGNANEAKLHLKLIISIRKKEGWAIYSELENEAKNFEIDIHESNEINSIIKKLVPFWEAQSATNAIRLEGKIEKIFSDNGSGFIKTSTGEKYYFSSKESAKLKRDCKIGALVSFELMDGFDKKRNIATKNACNIRLK